MQLTKHSTVQGYNKWQRIPKEEVCCTRCKGRIPEEIFTSWQEVRYDCNILPLDADFCLFHSVSELSEYYVQWHSSDELEAVHLEYLPVYHVFRCSICSSNKESRGTSSCITPKHLHSHPHQHLPHMAATELQTVMTNLLRRYPLHQGQHPSVPFFPNNILPPLIPGLQVEMGVYCTLCLQLHKGAESVTRRRLVTHIKKQHPGITPDSVIATGNIQAFYQCGNATIWFPVDTSNSLHDFNQLQQSYLQDTRGIRSQLGSTVVRAFDPKDRSPLMTKHKWDLLLDGLSPQSILSLIALPSRDEPMYLKETLKDWVYEFFLEVNTYIDHHQDSPLLQQVMYEGYEAGVLSDKRMRNLNANTVKDYSQIFLRILLLLLRYRSAHWEGIHLSIAEEEEKELQVLEEALKVKDKEKGHSAILNIGFMLLNQELTSLDGASWDYTIYKFLVFSSVRMGGVFEEAANIAPRVTRIQWVMRAVVIKKILVDLGTIRQTPQMLHE